MVTRWTIALAATLGVASSLVMLHGCGGTNGSTGGSDSGSGDGTTDGSGDGNTNGDALGDSSSGDGAHGDGGTCVPGCPKNVTCGQYTDCAGHVLVCGTPCAKGMVCTSSGGGQSCQTPSCTGKCGELGTDPCGVPITCGGCATGQSCVNNTCVTQTPPSDAGSHCGTLTCTPAMNVNLCGTVSDGCGHTKDCACPTGQQCTGGVCGAPPPECETDAGARCGTVPNACGSGNVQCGGCTGNTQCMAGTCTACAPPSCGSATCGEMNNGCGPGVTCGTCGTGEQCYQGGCCTPSTCQAVIDAGGLSGCGMVDLGCGVHKMCSTCDVNQVCQNGSCCNVKSCVDLLDAGSITGCAPVDLGCGIQRSCAPCGPGERCMGDLCVACVAKTCADFGNTGCGHDDGCGNKLDCCGAGTSCLGGDLCCPAGDVVYQGTCCLPQCDNSLPAGPQMSCGEVLYCNGSGSQ